jgi:hypothetical protein
MRLLDIFAARTVDARIPGGTWYANQKFMSAADWRRYPGIVFQRLEWSFGIDRWFVVVAGITLVLLWFRRKDSAISALILLAGGFSWYYVMFQHTHIHWFAGQYSFMAICAIFGLIISETATTISAAWHGTPIAIALPFEQPRSATPGSPPSIAPRLASISAAILLATASSLLVWPYLKKQYGLVRQTVATSQIVEAKYHQAIQDICRTSTEITLADLELAAQAWEIRWYARQLADTNTMPVCPTQKR